MSPRTLLAAAIGGAFLLGCAYPWPDVKSAADCNGQQCDVSITVSRHDTPDFRCFVEKAVPDVLIVKHARPVLVKFEFDPGSIASGYRFPVGGNGIVFANPAGWECRALPGNTRIDCMDKAGPGEYKYMVNAVRGSTVCEPLDPWIVNQ